MLKLKAGRCDSDPQEAVVEGHLHVAGIHLYVADIKAKSIQRAKPGGYKSLETK